MNRLVVPALISAIVVFVWTFISWTIIGWHDLETGNLLTAAIALYERAGFKRRGPFGDYPDAATSIFMEKPL